MENEYKICYCVGDRKEDLWWIYNKWSYNNEHEKIKREHIKLLNYVIETLIKDGYNYFICDLNNLAEMNFAKSVLSLREEKYPTIQLEIVNSKKRKPKYYSEFEYLFISAIEHHSNVIKTPSQSECFRTLIKNADCVLALWNGEKNTTYKKIKYARKVQQRIEYIALPPLSHKTALLNEKYYQRFFRSKAMEKQRETT